MLGVVLWYNPDSGTGIIWCEDQGPLAFLGPEVRLPSGAKSPESGDQLVMSLETREGARYVRDVFSWTPGGTGQDPRDILSGYHQSQERAGRLSIVA